MTEALRPIRLALLGGGPDAFIGAVHWRAAMLDRRFELVAGAFSRDQVRSVQQAGALAVAPERAYSSIDALITGEEARADGVEAVAIATPNYSHVDIATKALEAGLHVICDKPMAVSLDQARMLHEVVDRTGKLFALTYTYTGYAMIREARALIASGDIGKVRKIVVAYPQGWLSDKVEQDAAGAAWRTDPARAGAGGCIGDIGVHAFQLAEYISGVRVSRLCADLPRVVDGRRLDDDCNILLRFEDNVPGVLIASQISLGERNGLTIQVYGDRRSLSWSHAAPDRLTILHGDNRCETRYAGSAAIGPAGTAVSRLPAGHPEGFIEAFANIYGDFASAINGEAGIIDDRLPGAKEGVRSHLFVETAVQSDRMRGWIELKDHSA